MKVHSADITKDFVVISPIKVATCVSVKPTLYEDLVRDFNQFIGHELVSAHDFGQDWSEWEIHPAGDEVVILLHGKATFQLEFAQGLQSVVLEKSGAYVVVPKGVWHTAKISEPTRMLFITPGQDTRHRPL